MSYSDDQLVERYVALRDWLKGEADTYAKHIGPAQSAMQSIENELHSRLKDRKATTGGTDNGTFYINHTLSVRVVDRSAFLTYVISNNAVDLIAASATKDGVKAYQELNQANPPGVEATWVENIIVRRK